MNRTFLINGRAFEVESTDLNSDPNDPDMPTYYEVSGSSTKSVLMYSGYPDAHLRVLDLALSKWFDLGEIDEGLAQFPIGSAVEV